MDRVRYLLDMTPADFTRHKNDGSLEGAGVKVHRNIDYMDIFPSCDVYYLCCDDETTPTVSFPRQALLFRKLCVHWPEILALVAKKLMNVGARLVPSDALASLWAPDGDAAVVAAAMGSTADSATSFCLYVEMLVRRGMLTPPEAYPFPRRPEMAPGDEDLTNRRTSTTFGRDASEGYLIGRERRVQGPRSALDGGHPRRRRHRVGARFGPAVLAHLRERRGAPAPIVLRYVVGLRSRLEVVIPSPLPFRGWGLGRDPGTHRAAQMWSVGARCWVPLKEGSTAINSAKR